MGVQSSKGQLFFIIGTPYKDQYTKLFDKSALEKKSSFSGVRDWQVGRSGKTKDLHKRKIQPKKWYDSSSDLDSCDPPLVDSNDDLDITKGDTSDSNDATCVFCDGKFSQDTCGEVWVKWVMCQMWAHLDCAKAEKVIYVCDFCK